LGFAADLGPVAGSSALFRGWRRRGRWVLCGVRTRAGSVRTRAGSTVFARFHLRERRPDRHLVVNRRDQLRDRPGSRRRHLGVDLVGRDLDDGVALFDEIALRDVPLEHYPLGDRLAHLGHLDLHGRRLRHLSIECMKQR